MYRILDLELKNNGLLENRLSGIYGIGKARVRYVMKLYGVANYVDLKIVNKYFFEALKQALLNYYFVDKRLKYFVKDILLKYQKVRSIRGLRIFEGLPVRGQTTRSNGKMSKRMVSYFKKL